MTHRGTNITFRLGTGLAATLLALFALLAAMAPVQAADERTLYIHYTHTKETARITFKRNGRYVREGLERLNYFLRDWRRDEPTEMDPALFDLVWEVYQQAGATRPIHVVSAYRAPATNNMLRSRSSGVAKNSQHTHGKAMDFYIPGVPVSRLREIAFRLQVGGVGYYPTSGSPFVHLDTASVRAWPRMNTAQLRRLFPEGRTLHLGADGTVISQQGRQYAQAEWERCHRVPCNAGDAMDGSSSRVASGGKRRTLMDVFFGGEEDEATELAEAQAASSPAPASTPAPQPAAATPARQTRVAARPDPVAPPTPTARPNTLAAAARAAAEPVEVPFEVRDTNAPMAVAEAQAPAISAPAPLPRPESLATQVAATSDGNDAAAAIAALDGTPEARPDFETQTTLAAYAPQPQATREIDSATTASLGNQQLAALPRPRAQALPGQPTPDTAVAPKARPSELDPFDAFFDGPIVQAGGENAVREADTPTQNALDTMAVAEGQFYAPAFQRDLLDTTHPVSAATFSGPMQTASAPSPATPSAAQEVTMTAGVLDSLPRFGRPETIWVRLE